jgi:hypothetical protein
MKTGGVSGGRITQALIQSPSLRLHGNSGCLVAQDLALLTKVRTLIHEEISLLTVLYFPFRPRTRLRTGH